MASAALAALPLEPGNRRLVDYWLSLWEDNALPQRRSFIPSRVPDLLPGIMIEEIKPGAYVRVRLSGTAINQAFGMDVTGRDLLELSPPSHREGRRRRNESIASGAAALSVRRMTTRLGAATIGQEVQLPFRDVTEDGACLALLHTSWRPSNAQPGVAEVHDILDPPLEHRVIPLWRE